MAQCTDCAGRRGEQLHGFLGFQHVTHLSSHDLSAFHFVLDTEVGAKLRSSSKIELICTFLLSDHSFVYNTLKFLSAKNAIFIPHCGKMSGYRGKKRISWVWPLSFP